MIIHFIYRLITHLRLWSILKKVYKTENIIPNLSSMFKSNFKMDWIGRIYTILNPNLNDMGEFDTNTQIYEYGEEGLKNDMYVEKWIMNKLNIASQFITNNNLFELLTYDLKKIDDYDNYLFIMQPLTLKSLFTSFKWMIYELIALFLGFFIYIIL